jgi:2-methylcitrate dehydratase PrpD
MAAFWLDTLADFLVGFRFSSLKPATVEQTSYVILDTMGAIVGGSAEPEMRSLTDKLTVSPVGTASVIGTGKTAVSAAAAFLNGTAGTFLEMDEGNRFAKGHPSIHVLPALWALAEIRGLNGRAVMEALVLGYEVGARIGIAAAMRPDMHPHGTWGTVGAALAVARLRGATATEIAETINVASSLGLTTSRRTMLEGATVRNTYAGFSNMLGIMAHDLVRSGFTGEVDGVGSVYGGIAADDWRPEEMVRDLGLRWEIARNYFKRHAACRYNHGALDALARIVVEAGGRLDPEAIRAIEVKTYVWAAQLDHSEPASMLGAKFSMPFSLATFIVNGGATLDAFRDPARADAVTRALARRVRVDEDPALTAMLPGLRPARVTVTLTDGRVFTAEALTNKGDSEDPYAATEVEAKFMEVAAPAIGTDAAGAVARAVLGLDKAATLGGILELIDMK